MLFQVMLCYPRLSYVIPGLCSAVSFCYVIPGPSVLSQVMLCYPKFFCAIPSSVIPGYAMLSPVMLYAIPGYAV